MSEYNHMEESVSAAESRRAEVQHRCEHMSFGARCCGAEWHGGPHLYKCCGSLCPGLPWPASFMRHPIQCVGKDD